MSRRRKLTFLAAAGLGVAALVSGGALLASATYNVAASGEEDAVAACSDALSAAIGPDHVKGDIRALLDTTSFYDVDSTLVSSDDFSIWCYDTADGGLGTILIDSLWYTHPASDATSVSVGPRVQETLESGHTYVLGRAGAHVSGLTIDVAGARIEALLNGSWWTASWITGSEGELSRATVSVHTMDGSTQDHLLNELLASE